MIAFVVLHYFVASATINCIESIRESCKNSNYKIVVVDNASPNDSGKEIEEYVKDCEDCVFLKSGINLGFANGNNLGYRYAKEHFNPDFIVCTNNDVVIETEDFASEIERVYKENEFYRMGPNIHFPSGRKQNPFESPRLSRTEAEYAIKGFQKQLDNVWYYAYIHPFLFKFSRKIKKYSETSFVKRLKKKRVGIKAKLLEM